ncbi:adenylate/guanylate cyclase domain-containing protein [Nocardioides sp. Kera G14]|uniref:adenylate/guanylate cyclase domain-containing protein n=1 Tax=Nocardioides sp. Kera G14 TaxID=2884264 RepID=UPI001D11F2A5|nr:adenylate/guanylate cyclase domain-containing protein [Nocardioides sp. Kera G14]UDY23990.1 adenylate/guanylate cyclase domain-containing protein [Nocardioides sp. Kera G14]
MWAVVLIVAVVAAAVAVALGVMVSRTRTELEAARERVDELQDEQRRLIAALDAAGVPVPLERVPRRSVRVAKQAARAVIGTAGLLRTGGINQVLNASLDELGRWADTDRTEIEQWATPEGLVTVLFSDIEGSTALNEQLGDDAWLKVLRAHDTLIRREVERCDGHIVKNQGDGYMVVFSHAPAAIAAAVGIQERLAAGRQKLLRRAGVCVRIGLHAGQVVSHEGDYFGRNVALAARIAAKAQGGEILVSDEVHAIALGMTSPTVAFTPLEPLELKGLSGEFQLWRASGT